MSLSAIQTVRPVGIAIPGMADSEQRKQKMKDPTELAVSLRVTGYRPYRKLRLAHRSPCGTHVTMFYKRECQGKKLLPRLEGAKKFFLTSSPCIDVRIRDFSDSPDSSCWRNDVHRFQIKLISSRLVFVSTRDEDRPFSVLRKADWLSGRDAWDQRYNLLIPERIVHNPATLRHDRTRG